MPAHKSVSPIDVNLLPKDPFAESSIGKFLTWALSIGRYIVVFTELIVILTFLSRFTLDRQLTDLNEDLLARQALLDSYSQLEQDVRQIQTKAQFAQELNQQPKLYQALDFIVNNVPEDIVYTDISIRQERLVITASAYSSKTLQEFVNLIKNREQFENIRIDQINTSDNETGINFIIRSDIKS